MTAHGFLPAGEDLDPPVRMDGVAFCQLSLRPPFLATAPLADDWRLYVIRGENVVLMTANLPGSATLLPKGTVIGMSGSTPHSFKAVARDGEEPRPAEWLEMPLGTRSAANDVVIAMSRIPQASMPFLSLLGAFIRIDPQDHLDVAARIGTLIDWIAAENLRADPATGDIVLRLAEILTLEIWRVGRAQNLLFSDRPRDVEYDPRIWRAIAAISSAPQRHWTVESMARVAGMSRSAFAVRYHEAVGQTPMRSLRRLRMHRAAMALTSPVPQVIAPLADAVGYGSDAAFNRAFAKEFGHPPRRYGMNTVSRSTGTIMS